MTIDEAIAALETEFGAQTEMPKPDVTLHLSSGDRIGSPIDAAPTLCLHRSLAAKLWYETARDALRRTGIAGWKLQEKPMMDLWRITIADARQTHRIAADRFSVVGTINVKLAPKKAEPVSLIEATQPMVDASIAAFKERADKLQGDWDGISGRSSSGDAAATDGTIGGSGDDGTTVPATFAGAGGSDAGSDADRRSAAPDAAAGPAVTAEDQP